MAKMRVAQVPYAKGPLEILERDIPEPSAGQVLIKIQACGVCHSDSLTKEGAMPGIVFPRVPGHEVIGTIQAIGSGVAGWGLGEPVGVGWHGGHCGYCAPCRHGDSFACATSTLITGITHDGGYAEYMVAPAESVAHAPPGLAATEIAPLMCAGITTFNALRNSGARPGEVVAVLGVGGLGHLGVQYARKLGFKTVAIDRHQEKAQLAERLGAQYYIDSTASDPAAELQKLGGAKAILATATSGEAMAAVQDGLAPNGTLMVIGAVASFAADTMFLLAGRRSIKGWYAGIASDSEDTLSFSQANGVKAMNEIYPLSRAADAYDRMMSGQARFRVVLTMDG
jgi:D-arabinose 1-dehydrogenase-like Zn-dependent alcohol dehydrogenase